jgi:hypothetical protein
MHVSGCDNVGKSRPLSEVSNTGKRDCGELKSRKRPDCRVMSPISGRDLQRMASFYKAT